MTNVAPLGLLASLALPLACADGPPAVCEEVLACCASLDPALASQCEASFEQATMLSADMAEAQCASALAGFRLAGQCAQAEDGGVASADGGPIGADVSVLPGLPPSQGVSEPCDPAYGLDACGAALFCAAFDGRTIPTCYPEGIRQSGHSCTEDRQCQSGGCHPIAQRCLAADGQACEAALGCASNDQYCSTSSGYCRALGNGDEGASCGRDAHCGRGLFCAQEQCAPTRRVDSPCRDHFDCSSDLICRSGRCDWERTEGASCELTEHCGPSLVCTNRVCERAPNGGCHVGLQDCGAGQYCQLTSVAPEEAMCVDEGPAERGEICHSALACSGDTTCLAFSETEGRCFAPCLPDGPGDCGDGWDCVPLQTVSFGLCLALRCSPFTCASNQICTETFDLARQELLGCVPAGPAPLGASCANSPCAAPGFCLDFGAGPTCRTPCDQDHACPTGTCIWLGGASFGVCD